MFDKAPRSPSYPAISLPEALDRLKGLYDTEGTTPADREVIAKALGYTSRNGASDSIMAALSHYGLLEELSNKRLKVSSIGLDIILGETGEEQRELAIRYAATSPKLFAELATEFGNGRFSNRNVESYLIKRGYIPKAAAKATKAFRDTVDFVERETQEKRGKSVPTPEEDTVQAENVTTNLMAPLNSPQRSFSLPVDEDFDVQLVFKGQLTDERIQTIIDYLEILKRRFAKRQNQPPDEQQMGE